MRPWPTNDNFVQSSDVAGQPLAEILAATRLLGSHPELVLHGGGNSSVKTSLVDITGSEIEVIFMKASGGSMAEVTAGDFTALRLQRLRDLLPPTMLTEAEFEREVRAARVDPDAADPSLETLVHAALPHTFVLHSHADIVLAITDTPNGEAAIQAALGPDVIVLDYAMPGFELAAAVQQAWLSKGNDATVGLVVPRHGLFTLGATAREAYERHAALVSAAHAWVIAQNGVVPTDMSADFTPETHGAMLETAQLRREMSDVAGRDLLLRSFKNDEITAFTADPELLKAATSGPITPDHATRTKGTPLILRSGDAVREQIQEYAASYQEYVRSNAARHERKLSELDPAPRVVFDPTGALFIAGPDPQALRVNADITRHAMGVITSAQSLGGYQPVSSDHVFDLEYWTLQQAKMLRGKNSRKLDGQVAVVTGAASGIGRACAAALLAEGCAVVGWDLKADVAATFDSPAWLGLQVDVTNPEEVEEALRRGVAHFGGVDILIVGAGIFPTSKSLGEMELSEFQRTMQVNVESVVTLYGLAWPLLELSRAGGRVVVIASKNVLAPGAGAAAYSTSKAAITQLSRVAALEWAPKGIRVNLMHPDAVFDTGLWTPELLEARAKHYGLSVDQYKRRNLLRTEVTSASCGALALAMVTQPFSCTTGAQVAIDGGSDRTL